MRRSSHIILAASAALVMTVLGSFSAFASDVEYDSLRDLLKAGNSTVESLNKSIKNLEDQISILETSRFNIDSLKDSASASGDTGAASQYDNASSSLYRTIGSLKKSIASQTAAGSGYESTLDSLEKSAQTMMISYKTMEYNTQAAQKSYDAATAKYNTVLNRYTAGLASEADVTKASNDMLRAQNMYLTYSQQTDSMRYRLLQLLGITDDGTVTIGEVPAPDVNAISSIDPQANLNTYVGYDNDVISSRHLSNTAYYKEAALTEADGNATAEFWDMYNQLQADLTDYNAAASAFTAAQKQYDTAQHKYTAGMLTAADLAGADASYASALSSFKSSELNLKQAYEDYMWALKGLSSDPQR